jgi:hypothetical protein
MRRFLLALTALSLVALLGKPPFAEAQTDQSYLVGAIARSTVAALGEALPVTVNTAATGTVTVAIGLVNAATGINYATSAYDLTLTGNTTIAVGSYLPAGTLGRVHLLIRQGGAGSYTVTWPGSIKWASGTAPTFPTAVGTVQSIVLESDDAGTTLIGMQAP